MKEKHNFKVSMFVCEIILTFWQICPVRAAERMLFARLLSPGRRSPVTSLYQLSKVHSSQNSRTPAVSIVEGKYARIVVKSTVSDKINWLRNLFSPTQWPHQNIFLLSFTFHLLKLQQSASQVNNIKFYYRKLLPTLSFPPHTIDYCDDCLHLFTPPDYICNVSRILWGTVTLKLSKHSTSDSFYEAALL